MSQLGSSLGKLTTTLASLPRALQDALSRASSATGSGAYSFLGGSRDTTGRAAGAAGEKGQGFYGTTAGGRKLARGMNTAQHWFQRFNRRGPSDQDKARASRHKKAVELLGKRRTQQRTAKSQALKKRQGLMGHRNMIQRKMQNASPRKQRAGGGGGGGTGSGAGGGGTGPQQVVLLQQIVSLLQQLVGQGNQGGGSKAYKSPSVTQHVRPAKPPAGGGVQLPKNPSSSGNNNATTLHGRGNQMGMTQLGAGNARKTQMTPAEASPSSILASMFGV